MGVILSGILGGFSGKVGPVIGGNWKGIDYMKKYFIPSNPQSVSQTAQRTKFKTVSLLASSLLGSLINTFRNPFAIKMSGYNFFIMDFIKNASSAGLATSDCLVVNGTITKPTILSSDYTAATGDLHIVWDPNLVGNQLNTDNVSFLALDKTNNDVLTYSPSSKVFSDGDVNITLSTGLTAANVISYVWLSRGTGSDFLVSDSDGMVSGAV